MGIFPLKLCYNGKGVAEGGDEMEKDPKCAQCSVKPAQRACRVAGGPGPDSCPTLHRTGAVDRALKEYREPEIREFARQASIQEAECYADRDKKPFVRRPVKPRLEEICEFADFH